MSDTNTAETKRNPFKFMTDAFKEALPAETGQASDNQSVARSRHYDDATTPRLTILSEEDAVEELDDDEVPPLLSDDETAPTTLLPISTSSGYATARTEGGLKQSSGRSEPVAGSRAGRKSPPKGAGARADHHSASAAKPSSSSSSRQKKTDSRAKNKPTESSEAPRSNNQSTDNVRSRRSYDTASGSEDDDRRRRRSHRSRRHRSRSRSSSRYRRRSKHYSDSESSRSRSRARKSSKPAQKSSKTHSHSSSEEERSSKKKPSRSASKRPTSEPETPDTTESVASVKPRSTKPAKAAQKSIPAPVAVTVVKAAKKSATKLPKSPAPASSSVITKPVPDVATILKELRASGKKSVTLGPRGLTAAVPNMMEHMAVEQCVKFWLSQPSKRVYPPDPAQQHDFSSDKKLRDFRAEVDRVFVFENNSLAIFEIMWSSPPVQVRQELHLIMLDDLSVIEQIALLQSVLYDAGYSMMNLVPFLEEHGDDALFASPAAIQKAVFEGRWVVSQEVGRWMQLMQQAQSVPVQTHAEQKKQPRERAPPPHVTQAQVRRSVDPNARREPASIISSSDLDEPEPEQVWYESSDVEMLEPAVRVPELEDDRFFKRPTFAASGPSASRFTPAYQVPYASREPPRVVRPSAVRQPVPVGVPSKHQPYEVRESAYVTERVLLSRPTNPFSAGRPAHDAPARSVRQVRQPPDYHDVQGVYASGHVSAVRPYISRNELENFYGTETEADRIHWFKDFKYLARAGSWTHHEMCMNLRMYLRGPAKYWIDSLEEHERFEWKTLSSMFNDEFCKPRQSGFEKYYSISQRKDENPRQYLWRLNAAAKEAGLKLSASATLAQHVKRFVKSLREGDVRQKLRGETFAKLKHLDDKLRTYEEQGDGPPSPNRSSRRDKADSRDRDRGPRPRQV